MPQGHKGVCNAAVVDSIPIRGNEILNIFISSLWHQGKSPALSSATQYAMPRKIPRKGGNGVSLLSLSVPCCMRYTTLS